MDDRTWDGEPLWSPDTAAEQADSELVYVVVGLSGRTAAWSWSEKAAREYADRGQIVQGQFVRCTPASAAISAWLSACEVRS